MCQPIFSPLVSKAFISGVYVQHSEYCVCVFVPVSDEDKALLTLAPSTEGCSDTRLSASLAMDGGFIGSEHKRYNTTRVII